MFPNFILILKANQKNEITIETEFQDDILSDIQN